MARDDTFFRLRIPSDLHRQIKRDAEENHRSMNGEIVFRLLQGKSASAPSA